MRQFELTKSYLEELALAVAGDDRPFVDETVHHLHPADIAEILNELETEEAMYVFRTLPQELAADTLTHLDEEVQEDFLEALSSKEIADKLEFMDSDDAADLLSDMEDDRLQEVISQVENPEIGDDINQLLGYPEGTAGSLMATEFIKAHLEWPVNRCIVEMRRQAENVEKVYTIYVVDGQEKLVGTLSLKSLLFASPKTLIADLYMEGATRVKAMDDAEEAARMMEKYDLVVLPVVDDNDRLIGRITIDDAVDVIREEAEKDLQRAHGISLKVDSSDTVWKISKARIPWLLVALLGGILGAQVIGIYEEELLIHPEMALFIPLIAAMGGNVGIQSSAIVVQGLASKSIQMSGMANQLVKELGVGMISAVLCSALVFGYNAAATGNTDLGVTVSIALMSVILFAACFGTFVPLMLYRYKIDPALATGPFITTANDILGVLIYFLVGRAMYGV
jgi:magnesium transporter